VNPRAEKIRIRYKYRQLVIKGKVRLPADAVRKMVGPDCMYKLYGLTGEKRAASREK
jgi:hypothetical protein